ncbi:MAG: hypothetical protein ABSF03_20745 [Streptosporangiaceae bacterium]
MSRWLLDSGGALAISSAMQASRSSPPRGSGPLGAVPGGAGIYCAGAGLAAGSAGLAASVRVVWLRPLGPSAGSAGHKGMVFPRT